MTGENKSPEVFFTVEPKPSVDSYDSEFGFTEVIYQGAQYFERDGLLYRSDATDDPDFNNMIIFDPTSGTESRIPRPTYPVTIPSNWILHE